MTIAAGYVCDSGIVLCADTQETIQGYTKNSANKLLTFQCPALNLIFAGSGNNATQIDETAYEILRDRAKGSVATEAPESYTEFIEDRLGRVVSVTYNRGSAAAHNRADRQELLKLLPYINALLRELLPESASTKGSIPAIAV